MLLKTKNKMKREIKKIVTVPENVDVKLNLPKITVKGPLGELERVFNLKNVDIKMEGNQIIISQDKATKREKKLINSTASHIVNLIKGTIKGYEYRLQICAIHFPITVKIEKSKGLFEIKNFLGENKDRVIKIVPGVDVSVEGDIVIVKGISKELTGQQAATIENITRVRSKDRRIFQDGIWIIKKEKGRGD